MHTWIELDTVVVRNNVRLVRDHIGGGVQLWAVVKANAYGHGLALMSEALYRSGVDGFVVADAQDALWLNAQYPRVPILVLNPPERSEIAKCIERGIRFAGVSKEFIAEVAFTARRYAKRAKLHLQIETGMHRLGVNMDDAVTLLAEYAPPQSSIQIEGIFTHVYQPTDETITRHQVDMVGELLFRMQNAELPVPITHVLASDALLSTEYDYRDALYDGVRFGRILYGARRKLLTTEPVMTWKTRLIDVTTLRRGESVSYDATFVADRDRVIGILPVGYSDGVDRRLSNNGSVLISEKLCPIIGRVCMNNTIVDLSPVLRPKVGDEVVLLGKQGDQVIYPDDMAAWAGTIDYEILARIPAQISRQKVR